MIVSPVSLVADNRLSWKECGLCLKLLDLLVGRLVGLLPGELPGRLESGDLDESLYGDADPEGENDHSSAWSPDIYGMLWKAGPPEASELINRGKSALCNVGSMNACNVNFIRK